MCVCVCVCVYAWKCSVNLTLFSLFVSCLRLVMKIYPTHRIQYYHSIITVLSQYYHSIITVLSQYYHSIITVLSQYYHSIITPYYQCVLQVCMKQYTDISHNQPSNTNAIVIIKCDFTDSYVKKMQSLYVMMQSLLVMMQSSQYVHFTASISDVFAR